MKLILPAAAFALVATPAFAQTDVSDLANFGADIVQALIGVAITAAGGFAAWWASRFVGESIAESATNRLERIAMRGVAHLRMKYVGADHAIDFENDMVGGLVEWLNEQAPRELRQFGMSPKATRDYALGIIGEVVDFIDLETPLEDDTLEGVKAGEGYKGEQGLT